MRHLRRYQRIIYIFTAFILLYTSVCFSWSLKYSLKAGNLAIKQNAISVTAALFTEATEVIYLDVKNVVNLDQMGLDQASRDRADPDQADQDQKSQVVR